LEKHSHILTQAMLDDWIASILFRVPSLALPCSDLAGAAEIPGQEMGLRPHNYTDAQARVVPLVTAA